MDFQRYNIKEKQKEKGRKKKIIKKQTSKQTNKNPPTTIQGLYMVFAFKKKIVIIGYRNKN